MDTGKDIPGMPMDKPRDWQPAPTKKWDISKVVRHHLDDGLEFYRNTSIGGISTSREDTYLRSEAWGSHTEYMHQFLTLSIDGRKLYVLPSLQKGKGFDTAGDVAANGQDRWTIGEFRGCVEVRDVFTYPWVPYGEAAPWITLEGIGQFKSLHQQQRFLYVLERFLGVMGKGNPWEIQDGSDERAVVEYDPELKAKIDAGELLL